MVKRVNSHSCNYTLYKNCDHDNHEQTDVTDAESDQNNQTDVKQVLSYITMLAHVTVVIVDEIKLTATVY